MLMWSVGALLFAGRAPSAEELLSCRILSQSWEFPRIRGPEIEPK